MFAQLRSVLIGLLVVLFLIALAPFVDGYFVKQNYMRFISALSTDTGLSIKIADYRLGWLSSTAKLIVSKPISLNQASVTSKFPSLPTSTTLVLTVEQTINHGPYVFNPIQNQRMIALGMMSSNVYFPPQMKAMFVNNQPNQSDMHIETLMTFDQQYTSHVSTPTFSVMPFPGIPQVMWNGMQGDFFVVVSDDHISQSKVNYTLNGISTKGQAFNVSIQPITFQHVMTRGTLGLWNGNSSLAFPGLAVGASDAAVFSLSGLQIFGTYGTDANHFYNMQLQLSLANLTSQDLIVNPSTIKMAFNHFNAAGIVSVTQQLEEQRSKNPLMILQTLTPSSTIESDIAIHTASGNLIANGQVYWPATITNAQTVDAFVTNTNLKMNLRLSATLFNAIVDMLYQNSAQATTQSVDLSQPSETGILSQIDLWGKQQSIPLDIALQLKDLVKSHLAADVFSKNVDQYVLRKEIPQAVADQLKGLYLQVHPMAVKSMPGSPQQALILPPPPQPAPQRVASPRDMLKMKMNTWVQQGYFKMDNGDYVTVITREQGILKLNGMAAPADMLNMH